MRTAIILSSIALMCLLSGCSDDDNGTAPVSKPDTPAGFSVTHRGLTTLTLAWDTVDDATEYKLYRADTEMGTYAEVYSGAAAGFIDNTVLYARTYWYKVSAENSGGESDLSPAVNGTTYTPSGFTVTGSPYGNLDLTFTYYDVFNSHPRYQSTPVGLWIVVPSSGTQAGKWVFYDQIEGINLYYHATVSDYPSPTGWLAVHGDIATSILLTPF
jgi:hypothetical protein